MEATNIKFIFILISLILILSSFGVAQDVNHNANDNVCCIDNQGSCLRNIPSTNSNNYPVCYENEDCYVPECTLGCCKVTNNIGKNICTYTSLSACMRNSTSENLVGFFGVNLSEECDNRCNPPIDYNYTTYNFCTPESLPMIVINDAVGGRFSYVDEMYYDKFKKLYFFFVGGSFITYDGTPFGFGWGQWNSILDFSGGRFNHVDAIIDNYPFRYHKNTTVYFVDSNYYIFDRNENDWSGPIDLSTTPIFFSNTSNFIPLFDRATATYKVDAALYYNGKYYFVLNGIAFIYTPPSIDIRNIGPEIPNVRFVGLSPIDLGASIIRAGSWEKVPLNSIINGCDTLDSVMFDGNAIYFTKGKKAWVIGVTPVQYSIGISRGPEMYAANDNELLCTFSIESTTTTGNNADVSWYKNGEGFNDNSKTVVLVKEDIEQNRLISVPFQSNEFDRYANYTCVVIPYIETESGRVYGRKLASKPFVFSRDFTVGFFEWVRRFFNL